MRHLWSGLVTMKSIMTMLPIMQDTIYLKYTQGKEICGSLLILDKYMLLTSLPNILTIKEVNNMHSFSKI